MPVGVIVLLVLAILVYFGVLHRVLDRMRLDDRTALFVLFLMIIGSFFNLTILRRPALVINLGGAVVPIGIAVYLIATADSRAEKIRGTLAAIISGAAIYAATKILNPEEQTMIIDPTYFFAIIAGLVGYLSGRSRRSAFIGGTMGVVLADIAHYVEISVRGIRGRTWIGGAGVFDAVVIAGLLAVALAEVVGETREFAARGPLERPHAGPGGGGGRPEDGEKSDRGEEGGERGPGDDTLTAAFGVAGGSGRGSRTRASHRARGARRRANGRSRPTTSGGAGWEPPMLGSASGAEDIGTMGAPPAGTLSGQATEPSSSLAPGSGLDLTAAQGLPSPDGKVGRGAGEAGAGSVTGVGGVGPARAGGAGSRRGGRKGPGGGRGRKGGGASG